MVEDNSSDIAIAIGEDAFIAGWNAAIDFAYSEGFAGAPSGMAESAKWDAWSAYDPPEHLKGQTL